MTKFNGPTTAPANNARAKLLEAFAHKLFEDFNSNGQAAIQWVRNNNPIAYLRLVAGLNPDREQTNFLMGLTDDELERLIAIVRELDRARKNSDDRAPAPS